MQPFKAVYFNFQPQFRIHGLFCSFRNTSSNLIQSIYKEFYSPLLLLRQQIPSVQMTLLLCIQVNQIILSIKEFSQCDSVSFSYILNGCQWWTSPSMHHIRQCRRRKIRLFCQAIHCPSPLLILLPDTPYNIKIHLVCLLPIILFTHHITIYDKWTIFRQTTFNLFF